MLKIYGADLSMFSNNVKLTANAVGLDYEFIFTSPMAGDTQKPEYLEIHPCGKIPAIDDDGFKLFESGAIVRYLADKAGSELYPVDLKQRSIVNAWVDFANIHVANAVSKVLLNRKFVEKFGMEVDERSLKEGLGFYERFLKVVDTQLGKSKYLAGEQITLADITLLAVLDPSEVAELDISPYGNVVQWRTALKQQNFYTKSFTSYEDVLSALFEAKA